MRAVWAVFCFCWCATVAAASSSAAPPLMSAEEAVSVAKRSAQKLDLPLRGVSKTEFLDPNRYSLTPPCWNVRFDPSGRVQVDAETGQVLAFQMFPGAIQQTEAGKRAISQGQAVDIATKVAKAMGLPADAVFRSATLMSVADPADVWSIRWQRQTPSGIAFRDDALTVYIRAASGQPTDADMRWSSRLPESMEVKVSKEQAVALGRRLATKRGPLLAKPTASAVLQIVHPNGHWTSEPVRRTRYDSPTRLAWVVDVEREWAGGVGMIFWIDAGDGTLLGGTEPSPGSAHPSRG